MLSQQLEEELSQNFASTQLEIQIIIGMSSFCSVCESLTTRSVFVCCSLSQVLAVSQLGGLPNLWAAMALRSFALSELGKTLGYLALILGKFQSCVCDNTLYQIEVHNKTLCALCTLTVSIDWIYHLTKTTSS